MGRADMTYMTYDDIEKLTGVRKATLMMWKVRGKLPEPDYTPNQRTPLWNPETITIWWEERHNAD
jgi:hypothetical protein